MHVIWLSTAKAGLALSIEEGMHVPDASDHTQGQLLIGFSIIWTIIMMGLFVMINVKKNWEWSGVGLLVSYVAIACEIGAAIYLW
jgi:hypothetical protein